MIERRRALAPVATPGTTATIHATPPLARADRVRLVRGASPLMTVSPTAGLARLAPIGGAHRPSAHRPSARDHRRHRPGPPGRLAQETALYPNDLVYMTALDRRDDLLRQAAAAQRRTDACLVRPQSRLVAAARRLVGDALVRTGERVRGERIGLGPTPSSAAPALRVVR